MNTWMARRRLSWTNVTVKVERNFAAWWWAGVAPSMPLTFTRADSVYHVDRPVISLTPIVLFRRSVKSLSLVCKFIISPAFFSYPECPPGSYKTTVGNGACQSCPGNTEANDNRTACDCKDGFYRASGETAEQACTSKSSYPHSSHPWIWSSQYPLPFITTTFESNV